MHKFTRFAIAFGALTCALAASGTLADAAGSSPPPRCSTAGLVVWISSASGAAGSFFYTLDFTNQSGHTCTLRGYPGVSAVNLSGHQLGSAAARITTTVKTITLANDGTATTTVRIVDVGVFSSSTCGPTDAAGIRVYPPNQTASKIVPLPFKACTKKPLVFMQVKAVRS